MHRTRVVVLGIGLLLAGLTVGFLVGRSTAPDTADPGIAAESTPAMLTDLVAALNRGDASEIASFYSPSAILMEYTKDPPIITETAQSIGGHLSGYQTMGGEVSSAGPAVSYGSIIAQPMQTGGGRGELQVFELDKAGRIARQWSLAPINTPDWR